MDDYKSTSNGKLRYRVNVEKRSVYIESKLCELNGLQLIQTLTFTGDGADVCIARIGNDVIGMTVKFSEAYFSDFIDLQTQDKLITALWEEILNNESLHGLPCTKDWTSLN